MRRTPDAAVMTTILGPPLALAVALQLVTATAVAQEEAAAPETPAEPTAPEATAEPTAAATAAVEVGGSVDLAAALKDDAPLNDELTDMKAWKRRYRKYNSWQGPVGGLRLMDPSTGAAGSVRFQLGIEGFGATGYLSDDDDVERIAQSLSISWSAMEVLEIYGSVANTSTVVNQRDFTSDDEDRRVENDYHSMGDALLGVKAGWWVTPVINLGGDFNLQLPNRAGAVGVVFDAIGVQLRAGMLADFRELQSRVPLLGRINLSYLFDHTEMLIKETEKERFEILNNVPEDEDKEMRHLITRSERFGQSVNRVDQFGIGLGLEVPIALAEDFSLQPMLEWRWGLPINRRGFLCPSPLPVDEDAATDATPYEDDSCLKKEGAKAFPMTMDIGARVVTPVRGLSALLGASIGLTGTSTFVRELAPNAPFNLYLALGYDYDARPPEPVIVEKPVPAAPKAPPTGRVAGTVMEQGTEAPVAGAAVTFVGHDELSPLQSGEDGRFFSYPFDVGSEVEMEVSHPRYEPARCSASIPAEGGDAQTWCVMAPLPDTGEIRGRVVDLWGAPVAGARVELRGPSAVLATTDESGGFQEQAAAGSYEARVEADGYLVRASTFTLEPRGSASPELVLVPRPAKERVSVKGEQIRVTGQIKFITGTGDLDPKSEPLVAELADLLHRRMEILRIRIEGPSVGTRGDEMLPLTRALAVKQRLVNMGVAPERINVGGGTGANVKITIE